MHNPESAIHPEGVVGDLPQEQEDEMRYFENPVELLEDFEQTNEVKDYLVNREKGIRKRSEKKEVERLLKGTDEYKIKLWKFFDKNKLRWNPAFYSVDFQQRIEAYWAKIRGQELREKYYRYGDVEQMEAERVRLHARAAEQLMEDFGIENFSVARIIVQFLSIDQGFDVIDPDRDVRRRQIATHS